MAAFTRRDVLLGAAASLHSAAAAVKETSVPICAFSKHFQWLDVRDAAEAARDLGFDAIDLTVRPKGHVLPERVADDLPKAAEAIRAAGMRLAMITTNTVDAKTPHIENVLKTYAALGGKRYRWDGFHYDLKRSLPEQLAEIKPRVKDLAAMNKHYGVCAMYHTHSGVGRVGASMWDLHAILQDLDPDTVSANYDIGHATVEGGFGGWIHSARLMLPVSRGIAVKDFRWKQNEKGEWIPGWCPLGDGMVNFKQFLPMMKQSGFTGPLQLHMEYPELGSAAHGSDKSSIPRDKILALMRQDVTRLKALLKDAGLALRLRDNNADA